MASKALGKTATVAMMGQEGRAVVVQATATVVLMAMVVTMG